VPVNDALLPLSSVPQSEESGEISMYSANVWVTLLPLIVINVVLLTSFLAYHLWFGKRKNRIFKGSKNSESKFLSYKTREWWFWTTDPIVRLFVKLKISPNKITVLGVCISLIAAVLFAYGWFGYAGWMMIFGASFDMFDGRVARITGKSTRSGAFFDSVTDRFSEAICFLGLAIYFHNSWMMVFVILALVGSSLVSYTRARGEGFGVSCKVGSMQRPERITYLGVASVFNPVIQFTLHRWYEVPPPVLVIVALIFMAFMTFATSVYRMIYIMNSLDNDDIHDRETVPQLIAKLTTHDGRNEIRTRVRYGYDRGNSTFSHVVLFHLDGVYRNVMMDMLAKGDLPNISRHLCEGGGAYESIGVFPSVSGVASIPLVTGCFSGTCDIPGMKWFDKTVPSTRVVTLNRFRDYSGWGSYAMDYDLSKDVKTVFEYSKQAVNIFGMLNRGCGLVRDPAFFHMHSKFRKARRMSDLNAADEMAFAWFCSALRRETDFIFYSLPQEIRGNEHIGYDGAVGMYRNLDERIGKAVSLLKEKDMYDDTALLLTCDCNYEEKTEDSDINSILSQKYNTVSLNIQHGSWHNADIVALTSGTSMAHLYIKGKGWHEKAFFDDAKTMGLTDLLLKNEKIDIIAGRNESGGITVQSRRGIAEMGESENGHITYSAGASDPFGFDVASNSGGDVSLVPMDDSRYSNAVEQLLQIFRSKRSGDIVVSAKPNASILPLHGQPSHTSGSLSSEHIIVPLFSSVKFRTPIKSVDIFVSVMDILGITPSHAMDGSSRVVLNSIVKRKVSRVKRAAE